MKNIITKFTLIIILILPINSINMVSQNMNQYRMPNSIYFSTHWSSKFSPDFKHFVSTSMYKSMVINMDSNTVEKIWDTTAFSDGFYSLNFSPDSKMIASIELNNVSYPGVIGTTKYINFYSVDGYELISTVKSPKNDYGLEVYFTSDNKFAFINIYDCLYKIDVQKGLVLDSLEHQICITSSPQKWSCNRQRNIFAFVGGNGKIEIWNFDSKTKLDEIPYQYEWENGSLRVAFYDSGKNLLIYDVFKKNIKTYNIQTREIKVSPFDSEFNPDIIFNSDSTSLLLNYGANIEELRTWFEYKINSSTIIDTFYINPSIDYIDGYNLSRNIHNDTIYTAGINNIAIYNKKTKKIEKNYLFNYFGESAFLSNDNIITAIDKKIFIYQGNYPFNPISEINAGFEIKTITKFKKSDKVIIYFSNGKIAILDCMDKNNLRLSYVVESRSYRGFDISDDDSKIAVYDSVRVQIYEINDLVHPILDSDFTNNEYYYRYLCFYNNDRNLAIFQGNANNHPPDLYSYNFETKEKKFINTISARVYSGYTKRNKNLLAITDNWGFSLFNLLSNQLKIIPPQIQGEWFYNVEFVSNDSLCYLSSSNTKHKIYLKSYNLSTDTTNTLYTKDFIGGIQNPILAISEGTQRKFLFTDYSSTVTFLNFGAKLSVDQSSFVEHSNLFAFQQYGADHVEIIPLANEGTNVNDYSISIYDILGSCIYSSLSSGILTVNTSNFDNGYYFVRISNPQNIHDNFKFSIVK